MPRAILLTEDNVDRIVEDAKKLQMNLSHLRDNMRYNAEDGFETYLITDGDLNEYNNITFTEFTDAGFRSTWKFVHPESQKHFVKIERV